MSEVNNNNASLSQRIQYNMNSSTDVNGLRKASMNMKEQIAMALPLHLKKNAEKYARQLVTLYQNNAMLAGTTLGSQLAGLMTAASLGLDLAPQLGQCYLIPYGNKVQFQLGYRGALDLAMRSDRIKRIFADVVYEKDEFRYSKGLHGDLYHVESPEADRGAKKFVYALAEFTNGGYAFDVWSVDRVNEHAQKFSKGFSASASGKGRRSSPWQTDWDAMAKKTLLLAIWKYLPISTELQFAQASDNSIKSVNITASPVDIENEAEIINVNNELFDELGKPEIEPQLIEVTSQTGINTQQN